MSEPFLGEIRLVSFNYAPRSWAFCNGQLLPINQNQALFSLLGTTYGGNGQTTFALPNLQGRVPMHWGGSHNLGETGGEQAHTVTMAEMPAHVHVAQGTNDPAGTIVATGNLLAGSPAKPYADPASLTTLQPSSVSTVGGSQAHLNMQPFLGLHFCIALAGVFPART